MSDAYVVAVEGLSAFRSLETLPDDVKLAASRAVNYAAKRSRTLAGRRIREQVNFPARYLSGENGRLQITSKASPDNPEATITGRFRATSLATFTRGNPTPSKAGVTVEVAPGFAKKMRRAFVIRLRQGSELSDTKSNLGLAIRLKPGESIHNKVNIVRMNNGLYLLYGPSVNQVFKDVSSEILPDVEGFLENEFTRLMKVRNG